MSEVVHLPDELAERLAAEAARRGLSVDELSAQLVEAGLGVSGGTADPLDEFIGCGESGDPKWAGRNTKELRREAQARRAG